MLAPYNCITENDLSQTEALSFDVLEKKNTRTDVCIYIYKCICTYTWKKKKRKPIGHGRIRILVRFCFVFRWFFFFFVVVFVLHEYRRHRVQGVCGNSTRLATARGRDVLKQKENLCGRRRREIAI